MCKRSTFSLLSLTYLTYLKAICVFVRSLIESGVAVCVCMSQLSSTKSVEVAESAFQFSGSYKKSGRVISLGNKTIRPGTR